MKNKQTLEQVMLAVQNYKNNLGELEPEVKNSLFAVMAEFTKNLEVESENFDNRKNISWHLSEVFKLITSLETIPFPQSDDIYEITN